jgi:2-methylaconitate cis-trans-isomerase PrpF
MGFRYPAGSARVLSRYILAHELHETIAVFASIAVSVNFKNRYYGAVLPILLSNPTP